MPTPHVLRSATLTAAVALVLATASLAQSVAPGHRLYSPRPGTSTYLVDNRGVVVNTWPSNYAIGISVYMRENGNIVRGIVTAQNVPSFLQGAGGGIEEMTLDGDVLWEYRYDRPGVIAHHDITPMPNGNVLMIAWEEKSIAEAVAAGRDPSKATGISYPCHIVEVQQTGANTGQIVWEWHIWDHMIQDFDATKANYGVVADHPELWDVNYPAFTTLELNHFNGIDYDPVHDVIAISSRTQSEVYVIDHSTTTAEAAGSTGGNFGKGGDILYRWGNPEAYGRGTAADRQLYLQHMPHFVPQGYPGEGNLMVFNNQAPAGTEVVELVLPYDASGAFVLPAGGTYGPAAPVWTYSDPPNFQSDFMSSAYRLPNGNTLICSSIQGRIFEVDPAGTNVWEHAVPSGIQAATFHCTYVARTMWDSRTEVSATAGDTVDFDVLRPSSDAGDAYLLLGSLSGSSPGFSTQGYHIPLNVDAYLRYTLSVPFGPYHTNIIGNLDATGRGSTSFQIPAGVALGLVGLEFTHVYLTAHPHRPEIHSVSNVETFKIVL